MNRNDLKTSAITILLTSLFLMTAACSRQPVYPPPSLSGRDVVIDVSTLKPEIPQFYTYRYNGKNISFFVLKLNERVVSFFDACASCYPHKRGYKYDDGSVVCRACNMRFSVYKLEKGLGGCYPIRLQGRTENGKYLIPLALLEQEAGKF
jgi:uncharacterized membrane protein